MSATVQERVQASRARAADARAIVPAALAAIAESAVWFIPFRSVAVESIGVTGGPAASYPLFILTFAVGAGLATLFHRSPLLPSFVVGAGVVAGAVPAAFAAGDIGLIGVVASTVWTLLLATRVFTMSLRDWRNPVAEAFGIGATFLLIEMAITAQGHGFDRRMLAFMVAQFFLFSMASRAASIRLATPIGHVQGAGRRLKVAALAVAVLGASLFTGGILGGQNGVLHWLGRVLFGLILPVLGFLAMIVARVLLGPISWIFGQLDIDFRPIRNVANALSGRPGNEVSPGSQWVLRVVGLLLLILIAWLLVRIMRRLWAPDEDVPEAAQPELVPIPVIRPRRRRRPRVPRLELPADTVRRWYAEALLALERRGLQRPSSATPAEYLVQVRAAFPECAPGFTALTRSYEEVRYGNRTYGKDGISRLEPHRMVLMAALERAEPRRGASDDPDPS